MKRYKFTLIGFVIAVALYVCSLFSGIDFFERLVLLLERLEHLEIDALIIPIAAFAIFIIVDLLKREHSRQLELEREKLKVYRAMLHASQHVLNNFLNQMQLFKRAADQSEDIKPELLLLYDQVIEDAEHRLEPLGSINEPVKRESDHRYYMLVRNSCG